MFIKKINKVDNPLQRYVHTVDNQKMIEEKALADLYNIGLTTTEQPPMQPSTEKNATKNQEVEQPKVANEDKTAEEPDKTEKDLDPAADNQDINTADPDNLTIKVLLDQIEDLKKQRDQKDKQIDDLNDRLREQMQMNGLQMQRIIMLEDKQNGNTSDDTVYETNTSNNTAEKSEKSVEKTSFWKKIFG